METVLLAPDPLDTRDYWDQFSCPQLHPNIVLLLEMKWNGLKKNTQSTDLYSGIKSMHYKKI